MRKILTFLACFWLLPDACLAAETAYSPLNDSASFQIAASMKLGAAMGEMSKPNKNGAQKEAFCATDADCQDNEKCKASSCVNVCSPSPCSSGYCLSEGNHSYSCVACLEDGHCSGNQKCSDNVCVDACSGNNCSSQSKLCTTNGNHGYTCYGCTGDAACANDQKCDTSVKTCKSLCPDSCPGQFCEVAGTHKAACSGCTSDIGCGKGEKCDTATNQCVLACTHTPESCAAEIGGTAADWYIKETDEGCECATDKKYVILADQHPNIRYSPEKYKRIKAVKDFSNIKFGTLGGYIEKESNLSQTGNAWVGCDSSGCALVGDDAQVYGNALVSGGGSTDYGGKEDGYGGSTRLRGTAKVYENAKVLNGSDVSYCKVHGNAVIHGATVYSGAPSKPSYPGYYAANVNGYNSADKCDVYGSAQVYAGGYVYGKVYGNAIIAGGDGDKVCHASVGANAQVYENAKIFRCGEVSGNAKVHGSAIVENTLFGVDGNAEVYGNARVGGKGNVTGNAKMYGNAVFAPTESNGVTYLRGTAVMAGTAKVNNPSWSGNHIICYGTHTSGVVAWQASYGNEHKVCPK